MQIGIRFTVLPGNLSRFLPLLVVALLLTALAVFYGPGVLEAWKFRTTASGLLADIKSGNVSAVPGYVAPSQQVTVKKLLGRPEAKNYLSEINSLKLTSYYRDADVVWSIVTAKGSNDWLGQGKLRWVWDGKDWKLDALGSYVAVGLGTDENWISLQNYGFAMELLSD